MPTTLATADLCDTHADRVRVATPMFKRYGGKTAFNGQIVTLKLFEDNSLVRTALSEPGRGKVLVIDGGGSLRCALVGDQLAELAVKNGWEGIVVYGCIRDSAAIDQMPLGVRALDTHPMKTEKKGVGEPNVAVTFAGVTFYAGEFVYVDADGIIVANTPLT
ncbi:MAG: ribonuclease E activity regulator RraA [Gammaproteobacteria bacterium]|nr:ribonuclease E activity regulator RraA [Gammaproteobacteria bacterium]